MIKITRAVEPDELLTIRDDQLLHLRSLGYAPSSDEISDKYRSMAPVLWEMQHFKCCYCDHRIEMSFNDVEHYRPKSSAKRLPGCDKQHGYWWLAFSWENLLYSCAPCNRTAKNDRFPLASNSRSLVAEEAPPSGEIPLLLDPAGTVHPMDHIEFCRAPRIAGGTKEYWWAMPRNGSEYGSFTIDVCKLNRDQLLELRNMHYKTVIAPQISRMIIEIGRSSILKVEDEYIRALEMMSPENEFASLTYSAFKSAIADRIIHSLIGKVWPEPSNLIAVY